MPSLDRTHWNRIFSVALFVEHVVLGTSSHLPELCELVTEFVFTLDKVRAPPLPHRAPPLPVPTCGLAPPT